MSESLYHQNKPLVHLMILGILCFIRISFIDDPVETFILIAWAFYFMGIGFAFLTMNYRSKKTPQILLHLICAFLTNCLAFYFFTMSDSQNFLLLLGAFIGSLSYNIFTKLIFKFSVSYREIIFVAIISLIAFLPGQLYYWDILAKCISLFAWTIVNGYFAKKRY
ncbi:hypothetical protein HYN48_14140 [Flavobacterium magnum]|uniref:Integral membrane protein n=1 Tax=Flavobacterium magnum TaxID=2162713 RepID=A0A2S0RIN9_9FLAO|nr:hypothetical protein [Flavobacterium magnum]AWA31140.1 hypothetical protein HYN48_14140 [Flavobacterium magnum]